MNDNAEQSIRSRGSQVVAYAVIDDEGVQHSLWFLESDATSEAAMVGGTVVRLGDVGEAVRLMTHNASRCGFLLGGLEMVAAGHTTADKVLAAAKSKYGA
jgi:hypothetical protein